MDAGRQIFEAVFYGVKSGEGSEQGEMGRPDMGRNKDGLWAGLQRDLQQVPGIQAQNCLLYTSDAADEL